MTQRPLAQPGGLCVCNRNRRENTMMLRKIRIALVATILALTATATVSLHSPAQAGITLNGID
jgi:hypothetical protein